MQAFHFNFLLAPLADGNLIFQAKTGIAVWAVGAQHSRRSGSLKCHSPTSSDVIDGAARNARGSLNGMMKKRFCSFVERWKLNQGHKFRLMLKRQQVEQRQDEYWFFKDSPRSHNLNCETSTRRKEEIFKVRSQSSTVEHPCVGQQASSNAIKKQICFSSSGNLIQSLHHRFIIWPFSTCRSNCRH